MKIVLLLGLGFVLCGAVQAQASCPPYCAARPITRVPLNYGTQQRLQFLQQRPPAGFATERLNAVQTSVGKSGPKQIQNPAGFAPMQQSQAQPQPQIPTTQNPTAGFGSSAPMQQSQPQIQPIPNSSGGFMNSGATQQPAYYQQQPTYYQQQSSYYPQTQQQDQPTYYQQQSNYNQQPTYYQSQPDYYQQTQQDQPIYYQSQQPVYRLTCQTQSLLCAAYQSGSCSCRSAITGGVEYGSAN
jgi:hypothetical protein